MIQSALSLESTVVIYESPFRTLDTLGMIQTLAGPDIPIVVARELTKVFEEYVRGPVAAVLSQLREKSIKGEIVILIDGGYVGAHGCAPTPDNNDQEKE